MFTNPVLPWLPHQGYSFFAADAAAATEGTKSILLICMPGDAGYDPSATLQRTSNTPLIAATIDMHPLLL